LFVFNDQVEILVFKNLETTLLEKKKNYLISPSSLPLAMAHTYNF